MMAIPDVIRIIISNKEIFRDLQILFDVLKLSEYPRLFGLCILSPSISSISFIISLKNVTIKARMQ